MEAPAIVFEGVTVTMGGIAILEGVSAVVPKGKATAIVGPNGAGKTTLLLAALGQIAFQGKITFDGGARPRIGYVPQRLEFDRGTPITVMESMVMGQQRLPLWFGAAKTFREKALETLGSVHAAQLADRKLGVLSGGEMQRVLLALAIQQQPDILILDEPASGVDISGEDLFCELLENLHHRFHFTQVMVNHDLSNVIAHAQNVICLNRRVIAHGPVDTTLTDEVLAATFGIHLGLVDVSSCRINPHLPPRNHKHEHEEK